VAGCVQETHLVGREEKRNVTVCAALSSRFRAAAAFFFSFFHLSIFALPYPPRWPDRTSLTLFSPGPIDNASFYPA